MKQSTPPSFLAPWLGQCSPDPAIKPLHKTRSGKKSGHGYGDVLYLTCWKCSELHSIFDMVLDVGSKFGHQWPELVFCSSTWTILWSLKQRTTWKTTCRVKRRTPGWTWSNGRTPAWPVWGLRYPSISQPSGKRIYHDISGPVSTQLEPQICAKPHPSLKGHSRLIRRLISKIPMQKSISSLELCATRFSVLCRNFLVLSFEFSRPELSCYFVLSWIICRVKSSQE